MKKPLEVIGLSKTYNTKEAVKEVSFKVNQNEIIGILGPNGCGKTTTIGMILGLLKPSKGKVLINGVEIENQRVDLLNQLNFISPYIELPKKLTVRQNLEVYGRLYDVNKHNAKNIRKDEAYLLIRKKKVSRPNYYFLSQKGNLKEAAKNLYSTLRKIKKKKYSSIAVCKIPDRGYGKTINDRLLRASRFNEKTT